MLPRTSPLKATVTVAGILVAGLLAGSVAGSRAADRATDPYAGLERFARVLSTIERRYVDALDPDDLLVAAIRGMTDQLDPHSRWLSPEEARALRDGNARSYEGIGVELDVVPEGGRIAAVLPGGPAARNGLLPGDLLTHADGAPLAGLDAVAISGLLEGPRGEPIVVTVVRDGWDVPREIRLVRDRIDRDPVERGRLGGVAYVRLRHFQHGAGEAVARALDDLLDGDAIGVVLDLRDNPGGVLDEAVAVADLFLDDGVIVTTRGRTEAEERHEAHPGAIDLPLVILVNGGSASASEIVAGALQDLGRATLVGTRTYGKGSVQVLFEHRDGSALKLTTARYYLPSGEPVAADVGRSPDVEVPLAAVPSPVAALRDHIARLDLDEAERQALLDAVDRLPEATPEEPSLDWSVPVEDRAAVDPQLARALSLLEGR